MAVELTGEIIIGKYRFTRVNEVKIKSSRKTLGDTCTIKLPKLHNLLQHSIKVGDKVEVRIGYDANNYNEFWGFVAVKKPNIPFEITVEDGIWLLKRTQVGDGKGKSWKSITLKNLLKEVLNGIVDFTIHESVPEATLSPFRISPGTTVAVVLDKLRENFLFDCYFRNEELFIGMPYTENLGIKNKREGMKEGRYGILDYGKNVVSTDLSFKRAEDIKLKAVARSYLPFGKMLIVEVGDKDGEKRYINFRGIKDVSTLKKVALEELAKYKKAGYSGTITSWGKPRIEHSGTVEYRDKEFPERGGLFRVDEVEKTWGVGGYRRVLTLAIQVEKF